MSPSGRIELLIRIEMFLFHTTAVNGSKKLKKWQLDEAHKCLQFVKTLREQEYCTTAGEQLVSSQEIVSMKSDIRQLKEQFAFLSHRCKRDNDLIGNNQEK